MQHNYLTNIPLTRAVEDYLAFLKRAGMRPRRESVPVQEALGRVTSEAVYAKLCAPHYNASAMDGIALDASLTFSATETTPVRILSGQFVHVDTGDPLPEGCDAVVMIEDVVEAGDQDVLLYTAAVPWQHVRQVGEDICAGDMLLPSYSEITPAAMGAMLASGVMRLDVMKRPLVGFIPTGDEIVPPNESPVPGDVMEFNSAIFGGMLTGWGATFKTYPIVKDVREQIRVVVQSAFEECDVVLIGAGTSAGRDDYTLSILKELGEVLYHGVAIKPGKPAILARIGEKPAIGIPGYPVSGIIVLENLLKPVIVELLGKTEVSPDLVDVRLARRVNSSLKYREFIRARLGLDAAGMPVAVPINHGAGVVTSFVKADCLLDIPQNCEGYEAGDVVKARLLRPMDAIRNTLSIVGSHDPLLDEAADLLRGQDRSLYVASSHVGSMGGIMAVKRGEAMMGGIHLLDEESGAYNTAYLERYFPQGGAVLVECVQRVQGLIVQKGNPLGICCFEDVAKPGLRYVNRQKGSGTRILCDYLMKSQGMDAATLYGYGREEFTHTAVAAQIAAGSADAGLGIFSAAKIYGLDFIPVCNEQYDLLLAQSALHNPLVQTFLDVLKSPEFAARLTRLGGYTVQNPGRFRS